MTNKEYCLVMGEESIPISPIDLSHYTHGKSLYPIELSKPMGKGIGFLGKRGKRCLKG